MSETVCLFPNHVGEQPRLKLSCVLLLLQFNPVRLANFDVELLAGACHGVINSIGQFVVPATVDEEPAICRQINGLLDGQLAESDLITLNDGI